MFAVILAILTLRAVAGALYARVTERQRVAGRPAVGRGGLSWRALVVLGTTVGLAWVASVATFWPATTGGRPVDSRNIVQVRSALAYRAIPLQASYCASKFAIRGFVDSRRCELLHDESDVRIPPSTCRPSTRPSSAGSGPGCRSIPSRSRRSTSPRWRPGQRVGLPPPPPRGLGRLSHRGGHPGQPFRARPPRRYLARTNDRGALQPGANPKALADATMASIQGGYLVSTTKKDVRPMRNALSAAYAHLRSSRPARPPPVL